MRYCLVGGNMIVKKVEVKKDDAIIHLSDDTLLVVSINTYLDSGIIVDEEISDKDIVRLKQQECIHKSKSILINKIARKKLSFKECESVLLDIGVDRENINSILEELQRQYFINDSELAFDIIHYYLVNKKGINVIKNKLLDRGIYLEIDKIYELIDSSIYKKNIYYLLEKYKNLSKNKSRAQLKGYLKSKMLENGYNIEEFSHLIDVCDIDEKVLVEKEITKFFKNKEYNRENITKITKKLLSKGFNYDIIKDALGSEQV